MDQFQHKKVVITSELEHSFKDIKVKNKSSEYGINMNKKLDYDSFCAHVADVFEEKEYYWVFECKRATKCQRFKQLSIPDSLVKIAKTVSELDAYPMH